MNIRNCKKCGKIYTYDGFPYCHQCRKEEEEQYKKVKEYIYRNPDATIPQISEETEISTKKIFRYLREGRLEIKPGNKNLILDCERCGTPINTGRFCDKCTVEMQKEMRSSIKSKKSTTSSTRTSNRMYTANRHKK